MDWGDGFYDYDWLEGVITGGGSAYIVGMLAAMQYIHQNLMDIETLRQIDIMVQSVGMVNGIVGAGFGIGTGTGVNMPSASVMSFVIGILGDLADEGSVFGGGTPTIAQATAQKPLAITRIGNDVHINVLVYIHGSGADRAFSSSVSTTYRELVIEGIESFWSGQMGRLGVTTTVTEGSGGIDILITHGTGIPFHEEPEDGWSPENLGRVVLYTTLHRDLGWQIETPRDFMWVAAHEFGHVLGINDGFGFSGTDPRLGNQLGVIRSIMTDVRGAVTELDVRFALRAYAGEPFLLWHEHRAFVSRYGISHARTGGGDIDGETRQHLN